MFINNIGWNNFFQQQLSEADAGLNIGRVASEFKNGYRVISELGEVFVRLPGKMLFNNIKPSVGDWVLFTNDFIVNRILDRKNSISRKVAGVEIEEQIMVSNLDYVFIATSLNKNFNISRIERYLTLISDEEITPVLVFTKKDTCEDLEEKITEIKKVAKNINYHLVSSVTREGINELFQYLGEGKTIVLLGSSGVGKSTLINAIIGHDIQVTSGVREKDSKGRHTTTQRDLIPLEAGGVIVDNPGIREIQLYDSEDGLESAFQDIEELAANCRFHDCDHNHEPGCAVRAAIENGIIDEDRLDNYRKMKRELHLMRVKIRRKERKAEAESLKRKPKKSRREESLIYDY